MGAAACRAARAAAAICNSGRATLELLERAGREEEEEKEKEEEKEEEGEEEERAGLPALPLPRSYQRPAGKALGTQGATAKLEHRSREDD